MLRTDTSGNPSFRDLIARVRATNLAAYGNQELPFERLVEVLNPARSLSRHPLFQVMLAFQNNAEVRLDLPELTTAFEPVATASAKFDLAVGLGEQRAADGSPAGINGLLEYSTDLFDRRSIEALGARFVRLLEAAVADPERAIGRLDILAPEERRTILHRWNDTARAIPPVTVLELFAAQVARTPAAVAVVLEDQRLTYRELDARANQLARHLRTLGVGPEVAVGLCVERSPEMLIGLLGILKAGGAYLPLDPSYPRDRLAFMLEDADARVLITPLGAARSPAGHRRAHRPPRCRRAGDCAPSGHPTGQSPAAAQRRLHHLHLGLDRHPEGRAGRSCELRRQAPHVGAGIQCRGWFPHRALSVLCVRRLDQAGAAAAGRRRRDRGHHRRHAGIRFAAFGSTSAVAA